MGRAQDQLAAPLRTIVGLHVLVALVGLAFALLAANTAWAADGGRKGPSVRSPGFLLDKGRYQTIEVPAARTHTYALGINNRGQIAGGYDDPSVDGPGGMIHGFVRKRGGQLVRFDVPAAIGTVANKINDHGEVVGGSLDTAANVGALGSDGFLLRHGRFTKLRVPGSIETQAVGINNHGRVVGEYIDASGVFHGFLWHKGRFTTIDGPDGTSGAVSDINDHGQMVGAYTDADGGLRGFPLSKGVYRTFAAPDASITLPSDINNHGQIVGVTGSDRVGTDAHGFVLRNGVRGPFTRVDVPGAPGTIARGIDDHGRIVGLYENPNAAPSIARTRAQWPRLRSPLSLVLGDEAR
jgi:probable HAF family extracellular repeat protein